jgi:hypothetical protein
VVRQFVAKSGNTCSYVHYISSESVFATGIWISVHMIIYKIPEVLRVLQRDLARLYVYLCIILSRHFFLSKMCSFLQVFLRHFLTAFLPSGPLSLVSQVVKDQSISRFPRGAWKKGRCPGYIVNVRFGESEYRYGRSLFNRLSCSHSSCDVLVPTLTSIARLSLIPLQRRCASPVCSQ